MGAREHPILFGDELVRAILAGTKTQTRRPIAWPKSSDLDERLVMPPHGLLDGWWPYVRKDGDEIPLRCPFGKAGDTLWVRECWGVGTRPNPNEGWIDGIEYRADVALLDGEHDTLLLRRVEVPDGVCLGDFASGRWRPSIHMPRWASRILLDVIDVRVERVQDIDEDGARAEGVRPFFERFTSIGRDQTLTTGERAADAEHRASFAVTWDEIYGDVDGLLWKDNPWVWVVEFRRAA